MKVLVLTLSVAAVTPAAAESFSQNPNWSPWHGCWQAEGAPANELVCIASSGAGVRMATLINGSVRDESTVIADDRARPVQSVGCSGTERARWSNDRRRVFLESDVTCGASGKRSVRGLFAFVAPDEWVSVQTATDGDSVATRVVRFNAVESRSIPAIAASFASRPSFDDVLLDVEEADVNEAVAHIGAEAAQEWMRLAGEPFELGYATQGRGNGSALEQVGRMSNPVVVREVVRVVERPVYVHHTYHDHYRWHYSPWGHHYHGWYWHRPVVVVRWPVVIYRNDHYRRDYWRYRDRYDRDRYDRDRYVRRDYDRDDTRGRVTRNGYSSGRERNSVNTARREPIVTRDPARSAVPRETVRSSPRETSRAAPRESSRTTSRASSPQRSSGSSRGTGTVTRTARARSQD